MILAIKLYKKRYDGHNKTYWATDLFSCALIYSNFVSC